MESSSIEVIDLTFSGSLMTVKFYSMGNNYTAIYRICPPGADDATAATAANHWDRLLLLENGVTFIKTADIFADLVSGARLEPDVNGEIGLEGFFETIKAVFVGDGVTKLSKGDRVDLDSNVHSKITTVLKKTVLDRNWLDNAKFKEGEFTNATDLSVLDYDNLLSKKGVVDSIRQGAQDWKRFVGKYKGPLSNYNKQITTIHEQLVKSFKIYDGNDTAEYKKSIEECESLVRKAMDDIKALKAPMVGIKTKGFGNTDIEGSAGGWKVTNHDTKVKSIPLLTREELEDIAKVISDVFAHGKDYEPIYAADAFFIDWEDDHVGFWNNMFDHLDDSLVEQYGDMVYYHNNWQFVDVPMTVPTLDYKVMISLASLINQSIA